MQIIISSPVWREALEVVHPIPEGPLVVEFVWAPNFRQFVR